MQEVAIGQETRAIVFDPTNLDQVALDIEQALRELDIIGGDNVLVEVDGSGVFLVEFINDPDQGGLGNLDVAELSLGDDVININGIDARTSVKGGGGSDIINVNVDLETGERLSVNNVNAQLR